MPATRLNGASTELAGSLDVYWYISTFYNLSRAIFGIIHPVEVVATQRHHIWNGGTAFRKYVYHGSTAHGEVARYVDLCIARLYKETCP